MAPSSLYSAQEKNLNPQHIIDYSFTKIFQPIVRTENNDSITFIGTCNPNHNINLKKFHSCLDKIKNKELKICIPKEETIIIHCTTSKLTETFTTAKFERSPIQKQIKQDGFFLCANCIYHKNGYFKECLSFSFKSNNKLLSWYYERFFSCDSKNVLYVLICNIVTFSILEKLKNLKNGYGNMNQM